MFSFRARPKTARRRSGFLPWKYEAGRANAGPCAITQNLVVLARCHNYFTIMNKFLYSFSAKRLTALFMCLALMITGIAAAVAMEHQGHEGVAWAASDPGPTMHTAHHMSPGDSDADCCEPDTIAVPGCHVSACCLSELQYSDVLTSSDHGESACDQKMAKVVGPSIDTPLPERPPRLS